MSATPADPTIPAPATKCIKCQNETTTTADSSDAANFCTDCCLSLKTERQQRDTTTKAITETEAEQPQTVKMKIYADLTTTETLDDFDDELNDNKKPAMNGNGAQEHHKQDEEQHQQQQQHKETDTETPSPTKSRSPTTIKAEPAAAPIERAETKMASRSTPAAPPPPPPPSPAVKPAATTKQGKVTRSSLNGIRSPTIVKRLRKSTRSTRFKANQTKTANNTLNGHTLGQSGNSQAGASSAPAQGKAQSKSERGASGGGGGAGAASNAKNRRTLFKRPAQKTPRVQACTRFVQSVFHKDSYVQIGDIVSIVDSEQNLYYAQIRGLLVDAYCEKSAFLTWLIPTQDSPDPKDGFDPATYLIGPDEELSRKLCFLEFVMHAPSNYYYDRTTPFPLPDVDEYTAHRSGGYIWTRLPALKRERERERDKKAAA